MLCLYLFNFYPVPVVSYSSLACPYLLLNALFIQPIYTLCHILTCWIISFLERDHFCRKFHLSPKVDNQLEAKHKPIQMMSPYYKNFCDTFDGLNKSVVAKSSQPVRLLVNDRKFPTENSVFLSHQTSQQ